MKSFAFLVLVAACGGAASKPSTPAAPSTDVDFAGLRAKCGIDGAKGDPASQPIGDIAACRTYMEAAFEKLHQEHYQVSKLADIMSPANDIAEGTCMQESAQVALKGEGCRFRAVWWHVGIWNDRTDDLAMRMRSSAGYLDMACKQGDQESCAILTTHKDSKGRTWKLPSPDDATPDE